MQITVHLPELDQDAITESGSWQQVIEAMDAGQWHLANDVWADDESVEFDGAQAERFALMLVRLMEREFPDIEIDWTY